MGDTVVHYLYVYVREHAFCRLEEHSSTVSMMKIRVSQGEGG